MRTITINGNEYELHYGHNALCAMEEKQGKPLFEILSESAGFTLCRDLFWAGLLHKNRNLTPEEAGEILDGAEDLKYITEECAKEIAKSLQGKIKAEKSKKK
jgi:hypothetical protein